MATERLTKLPAFVEIPDPQCCISASGHRDPTPTKLARCDDHDGALVTA